MVKLNCADTHRLSDSTWTAFTSEARERNLPPWHLFSLVGTSQISGAFYLLSPYLLLSIVTGKRSRACFVKTHLQAHNAKISTLFFSERWRLLHFLQCMRHSFPQLKVFGVTWPSNTVINTKRTIWSGTIYCINITFILLHLVIWHASSTEKPQSSCCSRCYANIAQNCIACLQTWSQQSVV